MKYKIKIETEVDIKTLQVKAGVRYWEDATIDGVEDVDGNLTPCRVGDYWCPSIDVETGIILNWEKGKTASTHFKICDDGSYYLVDDKENIVLSIEDDYVPSILCPKRSGYGDYIIMDIDENGKINNWDFNINDFETDGE